MDHTRDYSSEGVVTLVYGLLSICLVAPPIEVISIGLTVQNMLSNYLGSEDMNFVYYHVKRGAATLLFHSILPIGYYVTMLLVIPELGLLYPWAISRPWQLFLAMSVILPLVAVALTFYWSRHRWNNHPLATALGRLANENESWRAVASSINIEFRRINKFTSGPLGRRLIVTDSWIMKTSPYTVHVAHQSDVHLTLGKAEEHSLSHESAGGVQFLNITVDNINKKVKSFNIRSALWSCPSTVKPKPRLATIRFFFRLNSMEYSDLKEKLQAPVRNARNIVIKQSLSDRFLQAFLEQVNENPTYRHQADMLLEPCIGCMMTQANVKLRKNCNSEGEGQCDSCHCRPLWCLQCMGKWFSSRQDQQRPETWMSGKSPCPMCRAIFCVLDVCMVED